MHRRAGAPRLIDWTGERCVPWTPDVQVAYEHLHRYLWAARLVTGRRVLDLASGEGFGAAILAESVESVVGVDIDERAVAHSTLNYAGERIGFQVADARDLSAFEDGSFGAVVAFEIVEHVTEHERVLAEIARVLAPDGLVIMSTPDRRAYNPENPFHVRELSYDEFARLLGQRFQNTAIWGQRTITGSVLSGLGPSTGDGAAAEPAFFVERAGDDWQLTGGMSPLYLVALASNAELPAVPRESTLGDCGLELIRAAERAAARVAQEREAEVASGRLAAQRVQQRLRSGLADRDVEIESLGRRIEALLAQAAERDHAVTALQSEVAVARQAVWRVGRALTWQLVEGLRGKLYYAAGGEGSPIVRAVQLGSRGADRGWRRRRRRPKPIAFSLGGLIELPQFNAPEVSIIVPVYARAELTWACLCSIRDHTSRVAYEVIIVEDGADQATHALLQNVRGARIISNPVNVGYLPSVNRGAAQARGAWLVLANNDIEVRDGWLSAMLDCAESDPAIGVVTPQYLYPDGSLNEAGGIIWKDGTGVNYGRGADPGECHYSFRRQVDYGSAAALLVRTSFWREVGGFDERFSPMYYEDTDLCFEAREHGLRVVYEPRANIVHHEGGTAGTDRFAGLKRHQGINRPKFVEKWRQQLEREHLDPGPRNLRRASHHDRRPGVLIVDHRLPMWDREAGALRMLGMIQTLGVLGCRLVLLPDNLYPSQPYTAELQRMGVEVWYGTLDVAAQLSAISSELALVIVCRPQPSSRWISLIRAQAPKVPIVYDTVDLHWLREARRAAVAEQSGPATAGPPAEKLTPLAITLKEMELALVRATEVTLVVSDDERRRIEADVPGAVVHVVPTIHQLRIDVPPAGTRRGILFVGGFEHPPNVDAVLRLVERVMPLVWRELDDVPVTIVGGNVPGAVRRLASSLVEVTGWVQDVDSLIDGARAMVAPMSYGAGLKGKVTQALAAGLPVVTTPIGAEGLPAVDGEHILIGSDDGEIAERIVRILTDAELWSTLSRAGQIMAEECCSPTVMTARLRELLTTLGCPVSAAEALSAV